MDSCQQTLCLNEYQTFVTETQRVISSITGNKIHYSLQSLTDRFDPVRRSETFTRDPSEPTLRITHIQTLSSAVE